MQTLVILTLLLSEVEAQSNGFKCLLNTFFGTQQSQVFVLEIMKKQNMDLHPLMVLMEMEEHRLIKLQQCLIREPHSF